MKLISREKDPFTNVTTEYYAKPDGNIHVRKFMETKTVVDGNKRSQNSFSDWKSNRFGAVQTVGRVPTLLAENWAKEAGVRMFSKEFNELVKRKLNNPDFRYLKTVPGKV